MSDVVLAPVPYDVTWYSGSDAVRFLNDLVSQEIGDLEPDEARASLLLTPRGKIDHVFWVVKDDRGVGLVTESGGGSALEEALARHPGVSSNSRGLQSA